MFEFDEKTSAKELKELFNQAQDFLANVHNELEILKAEKIKAQQKCLGKTPSKALLTARKNYDNKQIELEAVDSILQDIKAQYIVARRRDAEQELAQVEEQSNQLQSDLAGLRKKIVKILADLTVCLEQIDGTPIRIEDGIQEADNYPVRLRAFNSMRFLENHKLFDVFKSELTKARTGQIFDGINSKIKQLNKRKLILQALTDSGVNLHPYTDDEILTELSGETLRNPERPVR